MKDLKRTKVKSTTLNLHNRINNKLFVTNTSLNLQYLWKKYSGKSSIMLYVHRIFFVLKNIFQKLHNLTFLR